jgi:hypothetical protein
VAPHLNFRGRVAKRGGEGFPEEPREDPSTTRSNRSEARDKGGRALVTAGQNMDWFADPVSASVERDGSPGVAIRRNRPLLVPPGHFRPTKTRELVVTGEADGDGPARLVAAVELGSRVGPSFGDDFFTKQYL